MADSRIKNAILNTLYGIASYVLILVVTFFMRRVFADSLGDEFLGINTLYNNIITLLSISELGISTSMLFFLYKPVQQKDEETIRSYMKWYARAYRAIAIGVLAIGLILTIFIDTLTNASVSTPWELRGYFLLFVANSAVSYLMAHKRSVLQADQKSRIVSVAHTVMKLVCTGLQILVLLYTRSFWWFLVLYVGFSFAENLALTIYVNRRYRYLKEDNNRPIVELTKAQRAGIWRKIKPLLIQNLAMIVAEYTDSLIITNFIDPATMGKYGNYTLIAATLHTLFVQVFTAFTTGFGNMAVTETKERCRKIYERSQFLAFWLGASWMACYLALVQPFIGNVWMGADRLLPLALPVYIALKEYMHFMNIPARSVQNALGLHGKDQWAIISFAALNVVLSLWLVKPLGVAGVVLATAIALVIPTISKEVILYKHFFGAKPWKTLGRFVLYMTVAVGLGALDWYVVNLWMTGSGFWWFALKCLVGFLLPNAILIVLTFKTETFRYYADMIGRMLRRKGARAAKVSNTALTTDKGMIQPEPTDAIADTLPVEPADTSEEKHDADRS